MIIEATVAISGRCSCHTYDMSVELGSLDAPDCSLDSLSSIIRISSKFVDGSRLAIRVLMHNSRAGSQAQAVGG
jgi:hypothetical protein